MGYCDFHLFVQHRLIKFLSVLTTLDCTHRKHGMEAVDILKNKERKR